ncbi:MAG: Asp-tRNA(Asn)/Glu-tRNA(Gln) amidotransferase GatCAB subunit A, partial [Magnetococcales bacterium]|nr:Asp-tRNA(Asn)/Glu-tRNA(Gln) amidotransferase GatCAB subunit A [Magnetococcales bacterium]
MELCDLSLVDAAAALQAKRCSALELTQALLQRAERLDPHLGAYITLDREGAMEQARAADTRIGRGGAGPLTGLPLAHKDIFCTRGLRTSCGSRMLANFVPPYDATVTQRLRQAGAVILGKSNMDEFAMGSSNETS